MQLVKDHINIDFVGKRNIAWVLSAVLIVVAVVSMATRGLNLGIDFTGGTLVEVGYENSVELTPIRTALESAQFKDAIVQHFGNRKRCSDSFAG